MLNHSTSLENLGRSHFTCFHVVFLPFMQQNTAFFKIFKFAKRAADFNFIMTPPLVAF